MPAIRDAAPRARLAPALGLALILAAALSVPPGCGKDGSQGPSGPPGGQITDTELEPHEDPPGVALQILAVGGGSGAGGFFKAGDRISVRFRLEKDDGSPWLLEEFPFARILVSGPTFNYQRVIAEQSDVTERATENQGGTFTYTFAPAIPSKYLPPLNDTPTFGATDGELAGQTLLSGTYTVGLTFAWEYTVLGEVFHDVGTSTADFLFGGGTTLAPRAVVSEANCNACHVELQAHGGLYRSVTLCLLCHTAGSEDLNDPALAGGTPDVTVNSRVLFHRIHNGAHLPSVLGIGLNTDGTLNYGAAPKPYRVVSASGVVKDYSEVGFPMWPNRTIPTLRDLGHKNLAPAAQAIEDQVRTGVARCDTCHGDPDGSGPLVEPAQGDLIYAQPSRTACGACHDDVDWGKDYVVNGQPMPPQANDATCKICHFPSGGGFLSVYDGHLHPLFDPLFNPGFELRLLAVAESGAHNGNGALEPGERAAVTFEMVDGSGAFVAPGAVGAIQALISGPSSNLNLVLESALPKAMLSGPQPFTIDLPQLRSLEHVGDSTAALGDVFATSVAPHVNVAGALTSVQVRDPASGSTTALAAAAAAQQNFVDVASAAGFARDDFVAVDDGGATEEYLRVQLVDGDRLWFSSPHTPAYPAGTRFAHAAGAVVRVVTLSTKANGSDYSLDAPTGTITELIEFGAGAAVLLSYTAPFELPGLHALPAHDSPDLDETWGEWTEKPLVPGTYTVGLTAWRDASVLAFGEDNPYRAVSPPATLDVRVGGPGILRPYDLISSESSCYACHQDLWFHEASYRGFDTCILCHGAAGAEDQPRYVAANAPATSGTTVNFRTLLHKIHMGRELDDPFFQVVGAGPLAYPDNYVVRTFADNLFPAMPGAASHCAKCHGATNTAWLSPASRDHPTAQTLPVRAWRAACGSCHDSAAAQAHVDANTAPSGAESCAICHDPLEPQATDVVHKTR